MRSRTGCLTCRQRKLKCDEAKPVCGQCQKASRQCQPSTGLTFRHQHNASMNAGSSGDDNAQSLNGFYAYKNTFDQDVHWVDIPKDLRFYHTSDPYNEDARKFDEGRGGAGKQDPLIASILRENEAELNDEQRPSQTTELNTNGLEALSAAALSASPQGRAGPPPYVGYSTDQRFQAPNMLPLAASLEHRDQGGYGIDTASTVDPSIDPSLTIGHREESRQTQDSMPPPPSGTIGSPHSDNDVEKIDCLLRGLSQSPNNWPGQAPNKVDGG